MAKPSLYQIVICVIKVGSTDLASNFRAHSVEIRDFPTTQILCENTVGEFLNSKMQFLTVSVFVFGRFQPLKIAKSVFINKAEISKDQIPGYLQLPN